MPLIPVENEHVVDFHIDHIFEFLYIFYESKRKSGILLNEGGGKMRKILICLLVITALPYLVMSLPGQGTIKGNIVLKNSASLSGVMVTLSGGNTVSQSKKPAANGAYEFHSLSPKNYSLCFTGDGYSTVVYQGISIQPESDVTIDILLEPEHLPEAIVVPCGPGGNACASASTGITKEMLESLPTARNPWTILKLVPGMMIDREDVGGSESGQQSSFYGLGADGDDTTWNIDGVNITDPSAIGAAPAYINTNSYEEMQVTFGANDITAHTGGIQLNFITKSGTNKLSGDFHLYVEDETWEFNRKPNEYQIDNNLVSPGIFRLYQYGINIGGPLIKDKLWWFGSWAIQDIHKRTERDTEDATWLVSGYGKLDFQFGNTCGNFLYSYDNQLKWGRTYISPAQQDWGSTWDQEGPGYLYYGGLSHVFGELMLNVKTVYTNGGFSLDPRGSMYDPDTMTNYGDDMKIIDGWSGLEGSNYYYSTNRNTLNVSLDGNYFLEGALGGDHEIRFGVDYYTANTTSQTMYPNQRALFVYDKQDSPYGYWEWYWVCPEWLKRWITTSAIKILPDTYAKYRSSRTSFYIKDTFKRNNLTACVGVRVDHQKGKIKYFQSPVFTWYQPGTDYHGQIMFPDQITDFNTSNFQPDAAWTILSPRVSFTYDIRGDGKNVAKVSFARYGSQLGNKLTSDYIPSRQGLAYWSDNNQDEIPQFNEIGDLFWYDVPMKIDPATGLNSITYDPDYNTPILDELVLKFEKALTDDLSVAVSGFYKKQHNLTQDMDSSGQFGNVYKGILPDGSIESKDNWNQIGTFDVGGTTVPVYDQIINPVGRYYYNLDKAKNRYTGLQFLMTKKLSNKWMANFSFTWQDWKTIRDQEETLNMNNFDFFDGAAYAPVTVNGYWNDTFTNAKWTFKSTGMYKLPCEIDLYWFLHARQGYPQPKRRMIFLANQGLTYIYPSGTKLGDERLPTLWMLNLGLEKTLQVSDTVTATLVLDWYNATNNQIELKHNLSIGADAAGEPQPVAWTNAGLFQFGVRVNF